MKVVSNAFVQAENFAEVGGKYQLVPTSNAASVPPTRKKYWAMGAAHRSCQSSDLRLSPDYDPLRRYGQCSSFDADHFAAA
jgi:hypothetical protein